MRQTSCQERANIDDLSLLLGRDVCRTKLPSKMFESETKNGTKNAKKKEKEKKKATLRKSLGPSLAAI